MTEIPVPHGKNLLPFQVEGITQCLKRPTMILGDEMGLGKTIQAVGVANAMRAQRVLVVCPASLKLNWKREIEDWQTSALPVTVMAAGVMMEPLAGPGWMIVNYDLLHRLQFELAAVTWDLLVYDEAHYLKTVDSRRSLMALGETPAQARTRIKKELASEIKAIHKKHPTPANSAPQIATLLGSTTEKILQVITRRGTGLPWDANTHKILVDLIDKTRLDELTRSGRATGLKSVRTLFLTGTPVPNRPAELWPIVKTIDPRGMGSNQRTFLNRYCGSSSDGYRGATNLKELNTRLQKFLVRRLKIDVLKQLPPKFRQVVELEPQGDAAKLVQLEIQRNAQLKAIEARIEALTTDKENRKKFSDTIRALRVDTEAIRDDLARLRQEIGIEKVPEVLQQITMVLENGVEKVVVMTYHHSVSDLLIAGLGAYRPVLLDGRIKSLVERQSAVDHFQTDPECRVFVGSIPVAGIGINLFAASRVIFAELDWGSGTMAQAEDRCHRNGQKDNVLAQYLVYAGSLDALMIKTMHKKEQDIAQILDAPRDEAPDLGGTSQPSEKKRGRPKIYVDREPPSATDRSRKSIKKLTEVGGKRLLLNLTAEANEALQRIIKWRDDGLGSNPTTMTSIITQLILAEYRDIQRRSKSF